METHSITRMMALIRSEKKPESEAAAERIWRAYSIRLLELARRHLPAKVRAREDEHDVLQHVYQSFCRRHREGQYNLEDRTDLWRLLVTMTVNKAINTVKKHKTQKRSVGNEINGSQPSAGPDTDSPSLTDQASSMEPTPAEAMILNDSVDRMMAALPDELQQVAELRLSGHSNEEIANKFKKSIRWTERKLERIRAVWVEHLTTRGEAGLLEEVMS